MRQNILYMSKQTLARIVILGGGTAGIMLANKLARNHAYAVTLVEPSIIHYYQPGLLFYPFGRYDKAEITRETARLLRKNVCLRHRTATAIISDKSVVTLDNGDSLPYDILVVATGAHPDASLTPGLLGAGWHKNIFTFYDFENAELLRTALRQFQGGKIAVHVVDMPIKCPVAPLEFSFLLDDYLKQRGIRDKTDITYVTPLSGPFTKPKAAEKLSHYLQDKHINLATDFYVEKVMVKRNALVCYDGREVLYDLLVTVPTHVGTKAIRDSGLGDDMGFLAVDKHTLQSTKYPNIFGIGDATNVPTSKAGSVAHFEANTVIRNIARQLTGKPLEASFDGHANCFIELGGKKGLLIDFNYDTEPVEGSFPFAVIGPLRLLRASWTNHLGKLAFRYLYWYRLIPGKSIPFVADNMSKHGKKIKTEVAA